jgi:hypothetical protein
MNRAAIGVRKYKDGKLKGHEMIRTQKRKIATGKLTFKLKIF